MVVMGGAGVASEYHQARHRVRLGAPFSYAIGEGSKSPMDDRLAPPLARRKRKTAAGGGACSGVKGWRLEVVAHCCRSGR